MPNVTIKVWHLVLALLCLGAVVAGMTAQLWNPVARDLSRVSRVVQPQTLPGVPVEG